MSDFVRLYCYKDSPAARRALTAAKLRQNLEISPITVNGCYRELARPAALLITGPAPSRRSRTPSALPGFWFSSDEIPGQRVSTLKAPPGKGSAQLVARVFEAPKSVSMPQGEELIKK